MSESSFVHLRNHSEFSLADGILRVKELVSLARQHQMPAVGLTDINNFYGLVKFQKAAIGAGIQPIYGADLYLFNEQVSRITLIATTIQGYKNLVELISLGYTQGQSVQGTFVEQSWLKERADGLICLSGGAEGAIGQYLLSDNQAKVDELVEFYKSAFPNRFYLELQRLERPDDETYIELAVELASRHMLPVVATNGCCFKTQEDFEAHEVRVCIYEGRTLDDPRRVKKYTAQQFFKSAEEMQRLFADIPSAVENTVAIAKQCAIEVPLGKYVLPEYPIPEGETQDSFFSQISHDGLTERIAQLNADGREEPIDEKLYRERLDFEINTILTMGFPGYFLIVMDFIQWAKDNDIPVGPGRGSGAGSLVAYALKITDLDPIEYDLLFERFLNPERVSMPDFDVDFCMEKRDRVIKYVSDTYGQDAVGQIITFGTMAAKAVVRDVARAQGKSYGLADKLSKMIPFEIGMTLSKAFEQEEPLRDFLAHDPDGQEIWDMAEKLEGITRNVGKHAGGVVISPTKLTDFAPLFCDESGQGLVTQYDKNDVEDAGLVKFDFLGLRTLTIIDWAVQIINGQQLNKQVDGKHVDLDITNIPLDDKKSFELLLAANTTAVFQLESRGMKDLIKRLKPDCFEDIVALVALFRPGPLQSGMVDDFINRKLGRAELAFPHPQYQHESLRPILQPTYGIILYQEQVMQIAQVMAGYSLGEADLLRRAMGKKKPEEMAKQGERFLSGAKELGHSEDLARNIFDLMEKFAGYGFNKSHSAAYALVSYQTAWLKSHFPAPFMAAVMSSEMQNTDKIVTLIDECESMKLAYNQPSVNSSEFPFSINAKGEINYGLGAIKGLGEGPVNNLIDVRQHSPFTDLFDLCRRVDSRKVNKRALEALIKCGALDELGVQRHILLQALPEAIKAAEQNTANENAGIVDLFNDAPEPDDADLYEKFRQTPPWSFKQTLFYEKETLGLYFSGHPIQPYEAELSHFVKRRLKDIQAKKEKQTVAGMIIGMRTMKNKKGDTMAFVTLDDRTGRVDVSIFSNLYADVRDLLVKDQVVLVEGEISVDNYSGGFSIRADTVKNLIAARQGSIRGIRISLDGTSLKRLSDIKAFLNQATDDSSGCAIRIAYRSENATTEISTNGNWKISPSDENIESLRSIIGEQFVEVVYKQSLPTA